MRANKADSAYDSDNIYYEEYCKCKQAILVLLLKDNNLCCKIIVWTDANT